MNLPFEPLDDVRKSGFFQLTLFPSMTQSELEAALQEAFNQCAAALYPLNDRQKQILLRTVLDAMRFEQDGRQQGGDRSVSANGAHGEVSNPLEQLTADERQAFRSFIKQQESQNQSWKMTLLNDWLEGKSSGTVQFIRERYGIQWVEQVTPEQVMIYLDLERNETLTVGDRIEVTNGLWEWVQETEPCSREWFPCIVVSLQGVNEANGGDLEPGDRITPADASEISGIIRFQDGTEYEIQGIYDWNRPNWRWLEE